LYGDCQVEVDYFEGGVVDFSFQFAHEFLSDGEGYYFFILVDLLGDVFFLSELNGFLVCELKQNGFFEVILFLPIFEFHLFVRLLNAGGELVEDVFWKSAIVKAKN
jgi:hypothetical protein